MRFTRRQFFGSSAAAGLVAASTLRASGDDSTKRDAKTRIAEYLARLARDDGGYGWDDQKRSHLTPTYAVIGAAHLLSIDLPNKRQLAEYVRTHHPEALKTLEQEHRIFTYQQLQSLAWLDEDASSLRDKVLSWTKPLEYLKQYEQHGYPVFMQEASAIPCWQLLGQTREQMPSTYLDYVHRHRRTNGSFNNTPADDGSDGNVLNTWWGLRALTSMVDKIDRQEATIDWLQRCQLPIGGFTHQPDPKVGGVDDIAYTWAAVKGLRLLHSQPKDRAACIRYVLSLRNEDGGFCDRPGWYSNAVATFYALDTLKALDALDAINEQTSGAKSTSSNRVSSSRPLPDGLNVYSVQIEAHGQGSPRDAVLLARSLKIHLWGAKNAKPEWIARAQSLADRQQVPVRFFTANEEYGTWVHFDGMGTYSHTSDIVAPASSNIGSSLANQGVVNWQQYREQRLDPLVAGDGRLIWQFGENEPLVRMLLDDSLARGGFAGISTFHFGNPDFTNSEPFLKRYRGQLPFVALQDAHGPEPWWFSDMTEGFRTLFLAKEPTWQGFLKAMRENWIVSVRHDTVSGQQTWMHGGDQAVLDFVEQHASDWQWWDNASIQRPPVSIAVLSSDEVLEAGRPEPDSTNQFNVRVRCAWRNTPQGLAKEQLVELMQLMLNDQPLSVELKSKRRPNGLYEDHYHLAVLPKLSSGQHTLKAIVKNLAQSQTFEVTQTFDVA